MAKAMASEKITYCSTISQHNYMQTFKIFEQTGIPELIINFLTSTIFLLSIDFNNY